MISPPQQRTPALLRRQCLLPAWQRVWIPGDTRSTSLSIAVEQLRRQSPHRKQRITTVHSVRVMPKTKSRKGYCCHGNQMKTQVLLLAYAAPDALPGITETAELF